MLGLVIGADTTCYRHPEVPAAVGCQRCERPICPSCMSQASIGHHCPECASAGAQKVYTAQTLPRDRFTVVNILIAIIAVFYLIQQTRLTFGNYADFTNATLLFGPAVNDGEWWRIVTSAFVHGGLFHIGFNVWALFIFGRSIEEGLGKVRFLLIYLAGLFGGSLAVLAFNYGAPTLGASGAVLGLAGALAAVLRAQGRSLNQTGLMPILVINLALPLLAPGISFWGHLGGIAAGFAAGWLIAAGPTRFGWDGQTAQRATGALAGSLALASVVVAGLGGLA